MQRDFRIGLPDAVPDGRNGRPHRRPDPIAMASHFGSLHFDDRLKGFNLDHPDATYSIVIA